MSGLDQHEKVDENLKSIFNSFWSYFVKNRRMAIMLGLIFIVLGVFSYLKIPRESNPEVKVPFAVVITTYPGASPKEVADQLTFKIEQKIKSVDDLEELTSTSSEGISQIFVEFDAKADINSSIQKLKDKVDEAKSSLPDDANEPLVQEISFDDAPIITYSFFGNLPYKQLLSVVEKIQDEMEKIKGVQSADIAGKRDTHILVSVNQRLMMQFKLNMRMIAGAIKSYHLTSPVGNIEIDDLLYRVKITADQNDAEKIKNIPIVSRNGAVIYLKDLATVKEELKEETTASRVSLNGQPSFPALSIRIVKKTGANILETVNELNKVLEDLEKNQIIPSELEYIDSMNMADVIRDDFNRLMTNALETILLIVFILFLALGFKEAIIGGLSIPFTFLVAFTFLYKTGNTFNFLVLFSLILGLGLLVDTTIVIMEGMHDAIQKEGMTPFNAALKTIKIYRFSLMSGMLTTISAFVPMYMMSGTMGQYFKYIPTTVIIVLLSAFIIGLFIIPAYAVIFMHKKGEKQEGRFSQYFRNKREEVTSKINEKYKKFLHYLLSSYKRRLIFLSLSIITFLSALSLPFVGLVKIEGFPLVDNDFMYINVEAPIGFTLKKLDPIVKKVEKIIQKDKNVKSYLLNLGVGGTQSLRGANLSAGSSSTHLASFTLIFVDEDKRSKKSFVIAEEYKNKFDFITEAKITVPELRSGPPSSPAIQVLLFGDDYSILQDISHNIQKKLEKIGGTQIDDDIDTSTAEFNFDFSNAYTKALLKENNLTVADLAQELRMSVYPTTVSTIKRGEDEIDIDIQKNWGKKAYKPHSINDVKQIQIQNSQGAYIPLSSIAPLSLEANLSNIKHFDGKQTVTVSADVIQGKVPADILNELIPYLNSYNWPSGYSYQVTGGNDDTTQSLKDLLNAMFLGILLIFLILVTQFNSFKQPFIILMSLPLSLIGVFYGFMIFDLHIGVATMIGIVSLSGIVINDAIILIDRINQNRKNGLNVKEAILEAGPARLQPIIITSITTICGILPISLTDTFWLTLGMAIVFGMAFSTILTLLVIPVFYFSVEKD